MFFALEPSLCFTYGTKAFQDTFSLISLENEGNQVIRKYQSPDGLQITNIAHYYDSFSAVEWVNYFENKGKNDSEIITDLWDANIHIPLDWQDKREWTTHLKDLKNEVYSNWFSVP